MCIRALARLCVYVCEYDNLSAIIDFRVEQYRNARCMYNNNNNNNVF